MINKQCRAIDVPIKIGDSMSLVITETRNNIEYFPEKDSNIKPYLKMVVVFSWKLTGISSKLGAEIINSGNFNREEQELYCITITSSGFDTCYFGFKTRDEAVKNALDFADRNNIKIHGYN